METVHEDPNEDEVFEMVHFRSQREVITHQLEISIEEINYFDDEISEETTENDTVDCFVIFPVILIISILLLIEFAVFFKHY